MLTFLKQIPSAALFSRSCSQSNSGFSSRMAVATWSKESSAKENRRLFSSLSSPARRSPVSITAMVCAAFLDFTAGRDTPAEVPGRVSWSAPRVAAFLRVEPAVLPGRGVPGVPLLKLRPDGLRGARIGPVLVEGRASRGLRGSGKVSCVGVSAASDLSDWVAMVALVASARVFGAGPKPWKRFRSARVAVGVALLDRSSSLGGVGRMPKSIGNPCI